MHNIQKTIRKSPVYSKPLGLNEALSNYKKSEDTVKEGQEFNNKYINK